MPRFPISLLIALACLCCDEDEGPGTSGIDTMRQWSVAALSGAEDDCPVFDTGLGTLDDVLFDGCDGEPLWTESESELYGECFDSRYPTLPDPPQNPNPESAKIRVLITYACGNPSAAEDVGCNSTDEEVLRIAEQSVFIEYRDGLFPILESGATFCPLTAIPIVR